MENGYSIKEFIEDKFEGLTEHLDRIEGQTIKTNGRVNALENHRAYLWGAFTLLTMVAGIIAFLVVEAIDDKIEDGIADALAQYEIVSGTEIKSK